MSNTARSRSRSAARLAAVQALYQQEMEATPVARLLKEFHDHRLGALIEDAQYLEAEQSFFDDIVSGVDARRAPGRIGIWAWISSSPAGASDGSGEV